MALLEQDHAFEIADAVIAASGGDETEVSITAVEDRFVRFAPDGPTQSADRETYDVRVRVRRRGDSGGYSEACASCGSLDEESVFGALARAETLSRIASPDPEALPLGGPVDVPGTSPSRPTQDHSFREKAEWIEVGMGAAERRGLRAAGLARTTVTGRSLVSSVGRRVHGATSRAEFQLSCFDGATDGAASASGNAIHPWVDQVDAAALADQVASSAERGRGRAPIDPGTYPVVLAPAAVGSLLGLAGLVSFGAREVAIGSSFMAAMGGEHAFGDGLSVADDVHHPLLRGFAFDGEGSPRSRHPLIDQGRIGAPVTDLRWAARTGAANTGHGLQQPSAEGPRADALAMAEGTAGMDELIGTVRDGLFVSQLHYVNLIDPQTLTMTGLTRGGLFRIEGGELAGPVEDLRFTHSLVSALRGVLAVGDTALRSRPLAGPEVVAPALALEGLTFTSRAGGGL